MVLLKLGNQTVKIDAGELVSYQVDGYEFIHQKGSPGWSSADTEMFPIIGPVNEANFMVQVPKGEAIQDQHGHLRLMTYSLIENTDLTAVFEKVYQANTEIKNKKYPKKSDKALLSWPYNFRFKKSFRLSAEGLEVKFKINGDKGMPYMLGYHPAFKLHTVNPIIKTKDKSINLEKVLAVGSRALEVADCNEISLLDEHSITIKTEGFEHFMCWTEVDNMICIEPITFYPYTVKQQNLHEGFQSLDKETSFKLQLIPFIS